MRQHLVVDYRCIVLDKDGLDRKCRDFSNHDPTDGVRDRSVDAHERERHVALFVVVNLDVQALPELFETEAAILAVEVTREVG